MSKGAYQGAGANRQTRGSLAVSAVSGGQNSCRVQEGATAEVLAVLLQTDKAGTPPTIAGMLVSSHCAAGAAETADRAARPTMKDLVLMMDD
jgi:hypothetical protein